MKREIVYLCAGSIAWVSASLIVLLEFGNSLFLDFLFLGVFTTALLFFLRTPFTVNRNLGERSKLEHLQFAATIVLAFSVTAHLDLDVHILKTATMNWKIQIGVWLLIAYRSLSLREVWKNQYVEQNI